MAWPWSGGLGGEHLALFMKCETEIAHLFMKELGHGQVGWDVVSLGLQGFLVPALSLLGLASLHVHLTWTNQPIISLFLPEQINELYHLNCLNKSTNHISSFAWTNQPVMLLLFAWTNQPIISLFYKNYLILRLNGQPYNIKQCDVVYFFFSQIHCTWQKLRRTKNDG